MPTPSEIEAALTGGVGQSFHPAVEQIGATIEHDSLDPSRLGPFGDELADGTRRGDVGATFELRFEAAVEARGRRQCTPGRVIDDLRIDMLR